MTRPYFAIDGRASLLTFVIDTSSAPTEPTIES